MREEQQMPACADGRRQVGSSGKGGQGRMISPRPNRNQNRRTGSECMELFAVRVGDGGTNCGFWSDGDMERWRLWCNIVCCDLVAFRQI